MEQLYEEENEVAALKGDYGSSSKFTRTLRRSIICAFNSQSKQTKHYKFTVFFSLCLAFISTTQGISLILHEKESLSEYSSMESFFYFVNFTRLDTLAFELGVIYSFFYAILTVIYLPLGVLIMNTAMKLKWKRKPHWITVKLMSVNLSLLEEVLLLPSLVLMLSFIKYTYLVPSASSMPEFADSPDLLNSQLHAALSLITVPVLLGLLYLNSYFFYENIYQKRRRLIYSMADSFVHRVDLLVRVGMVVCYCFLSVLSTLWYRLGILVSACAMVVFFFRRLVYYNEIINVENTGKKAVVVWSILSYFIGYTVDSATTMIVLILFVSPFLVVRIYFLIKNRLKSLSRLRLTDITEAYLIELKLRACFQALEGSDASMEELLHREIEQVFTFATKQFGKHPLLPLWESTYYYYYRKDAFLALLKLSKVHLTEQTLESQFFTEKMMDKYLSMDGSPERLYLRYLTLLDQAKRSDESCCLLLLSLCTELLSRKLDPVKFEDSVGILSKHIQKTKKRYYKVLELFEDNEEVLKLLGSFLSDVVKDCDGRGLMLRAQVLRRREATHGAVALLGEMINSQQALIVVAGGGSSIGKVVLVSPKAYNVLNAGKMDVIEKSMSLFLPLPFRDIFSSTLSDLYLFGSYLLEISNLFRLLVDTQGFLIPVSITTKITTWDNQPYILLFLTLVDCTDLVLLDSNFIILGNSRLADVLGGDHSKIYEGCRVESVLPGLRELVETEQKEMFYEVHGGGGVYSVGVNRLKFKELSLMAITLDSVRGARKSTSLSTSSRFGFSRRFSSSKGVRFTNAAMRPMPSVSTETKVEVLTSIQEKTLDSVNFSETEAKVRRKIEMSSSGTISSVTVPFEVLKGAKVGLKLKRVKMLLLLAFLVLVAGLVASVIFVTNILTSLKSITVIKEYGDRNCQILHLAYDARSLALSDDHRFGYDREALKQRIANNSHTLEDMTKYMKSLVGTGSEEADSFLIQQKVTLWRRIENTYEFEKKTMLDALYDYTTAATILISTPPPYEPQPESFFIYRNGPGEFLSAANETLHIRVIGEAAKREEALAIISYLIYMCVGLIVVPLSALVAPYFYLFEKENKSIWLSVFSLPRDSILDARTAFLDRLSNYFNNEAVLEIPMSKFPKPVSPRPLWPRFLFKMTMYLLANAVFFVILEVVFFVPVRNLALTIPNYLFWAAIRSKIVAEGLFWTREHMLQHLGVHRYEDYVTQGGFWYDPMERIANASRSMMFIKTVLNFGNERYGVNIVKKSDRYLDYIYTSSCDYSSDANCPSTEESLGATYLAGSWAFDMNTIATSTLQYSTHAISLLSSFEALSGFLIEASQHVVDLYEADAVASIDQSSVEVVTLTVAFVGILFLMYVGVYARSLTAMLTRAKQALNVHRMIRTK